MFTLPSEIRRVLNTTNALESVHSRLRKILKTRGLFPTDDAATTDLARAATGRGRRITGGRR
jgi:transposase-like protein